MLDTSWHNTRSRSRHKRPITRHRGRTKVNIIEAAERLFGLHGIDGVSLRQISIEAGAVNNCAITYHFENFEGLVHAIFAHRLPPIEARRRGMLAAIKAHDREPGVRDLIFILYAPLTEQVDHSGSCSFAAFLAGLSHFDHLFGRRGVAELAPVTADVVRLLSRRLPQLASEQFWRRFALVNHMVLKGIIQLGINARGVRFDELLDMAVASLQAGGVEGAYVRVRWNGGTHFEDLQSEVGASVELDKSIRHGRCALRRVPGGGV